MKPILTKFAAFAALAISGAIVTSGAFTTASAQGRPAEAAWEQTDKEGPPAKGGNYGVPSLLAEIMTLKADLVQCEAELKYTQDELKDTQDELKDTQDELDYEKQIYRVPQTGQQRCWDNVDPDPTVPHSVIPCENTYQDGETRAGLAPPEPGNRFTDNGNGTITDHFTDLIWLKAAYCIGESTWQAASDTVFNLQGFVGGFEDCFLTDQSTPGEWRLPNVHELMSLLDYDNVSPCLPDGHPFSLDSFNSGGHSFWTSTTFALGSDFNFEDWVFPKESGLRYGENLPRFGDAYVVSLSSGEVNHVPKDGKGRGDVSPARLHRTLAVRERFAPPRD